jgi:hypothetical protein
MVHPRLRDIQYLHIKISKVDKDRLVKYMNSKNFYNISEFIRVKMLGLVERDNKET